MIVNPLFFYVMSVADGVKGICQAILIFSAVAELVLCVWLSMCFSSEERKEVLALMKAAALVFALAAVVFIFSPSERTLLMMQAANLATPENVEAVFEALKDAIDYAASVTKGG